MEIPHRPDAATTNNALTSLYLPLTIRNPEPLRLVSLAATLAISAFFVFWPHIRGVSESIVQNVATLLFVVTLAGPSRALAGFWPSWPWGGNR